MARKMNKRNTKPKVSFEKKVISVIRSQAETKQKTISVFNNTNIYGNGLNGGNTNGGAQMNNILEGLALTNGDTQDTRNGNSISNCSLSLRGFVESNGYDTTTNPDIMPYECHIVFFKNKAGADEPGATTNFQNFKSLPGNLLGPVDGSIMNSLYPYNKDLYTIKKVKVIKLKGAPYAAQNSNTQLSAYNDGNSVQYKRFRVNIPIKKVLKYQDNATLPTNDWLSVGCFIIIGSGSIYTGTQTKAAISMDATLRFDDF